MKTRSRHANWLRKADKQAERALSLGRSILTNRSTGFYYPKAAASEEEEE